MPRGHLERRQYKKDEITQELLKVFQYYKSFREEYEDKALDWYETFVGYIEEQDTPGANIHVPKTYQIIDAIRAQLVSIFFGKRPYIEFRPMPEAGDAESFIANEDKAKVAASIVDEQLEKSNIQREFYDFITSLLIFPAGIMSVGWRYETDYIRRRTKVPEIDAQSGLYTGRYIWDYIESEEVVYDDNEVRNVDFFDFWIDPESKNLEDARGCFHREHVTLDELEEKVHQLSKLSDGVLYEVDFDKLSHYGRQSERGSEKRLSSVGRKGKRFDAYRQSSDERLKGKSEIELLHYWENDRHSIIVNRQQALYDGPNPYWRHKEKPFIMASYDPLPSEPYGLSAVQILEPLQEEINTIHNQRIDNVSMIINKMWLRRRGADIKDDDLVSRPNGVVDVDSFEDLMPMEMGDVPESAYAQEEVLLNHIQNALGTPPVMRGASARGDQTATEVSQQTEMALGRYEAKMRLFDEIGISRIARQMDLNNQQFITDKRMVRIGGEEQYKWREVDPGYLIGEYSYSPAKSTVDDATNPEVRREQLTEMISFLLQAEVPFINYEQLVVEWLESFNIENPQKFLIDAEDMQAAREQYFQQISGAPENQPQQNTAGSVQQNIGGNQYQRPNRRAGGYRTDGTPQPQPGQRGGARNRPTRRPQ